MMMMTMMMTRALFLLCQILEVNKHNFEHIQHDRALEILRGNTQLAISVKSNLQGRSIGLAIHVRVGPLMVSLRVICAFQLFMAFNIMYPNTGSWDFFNMLCDQMDWKKE